MEERTKLSGITPLVFAITVALSAGFIGIVKLCSDTIIPFSFWGAWTVHGGFWQGIGAYWPLFLYGFLLNAAIVTWKRDLLRQLDASPTEVFVKGCGLSLWAGFTEEIIFRWLGFLSSIAFMKFFNFILFGLVAWLFSAVFGPLADWATLGHLHSVLSHESGWWVGAAMLSANSSFRNGHKYQGFLGFTNSWFLGMVFFHCMFHYGLPVAIAVHALYDIAVFAALAALMPNRD